MPKVQNPDLLHMDFHGDRVQVTQNEYELSADEWDSRRTEAFAQLRTFGFIPAELLDLVERFKDQSAVQVSVSKLKDELAVQFGVKVIDNKHCSPASRLAEITVAKKRMEEDDKKEGMTASDALAFMLRIFLRELKQAAKARQAAPVRRLKLVPKSLISEIATDLLGSCATWGVPPGHFLISLIRELLDLNHDRQGMSRDIETKARAARIVAQAPTVQTRELARALHVNASTISRWRRSSDFRQLVQREQATLDSFAKERMGSPGEVQRAHARGDI